MKCWLIVVQIQVQEAARPSALCVCNSRHQFPWSTGHKFGNILPKSKSESGLLLLFSLSTTGMYIILVACLNISTCCGFYAAEVIQMWLILNSCDVVSRHKTMLSSAANHGNKIKRFERLDFWKPEIDKGKIVCRRALDSLDLKWGQTCLAQ